jgi:flavin-dependent thymidylate synthase
MKVSLIDFTGYGCNDMWRAARLLIYSKNTRLEQGEDTRNKVLRMNNDKLIEELHAISMTLRSSWEFVDFTFEVKDVTRAFTHQLVRTRTASYAQQAMRVVDMQGFKTLVPETVKERRLDDQWDLHMAHTDDLYTTMIQLGVPSEDARGILPTNILTNILVKFNLRTFADLVGKRENLRAQGEYADVVREMKRLAIGEMPWLDMFLNPKRTHTPSLDAILKTMLDGRPPAQVPAVNNALKELDMLKGTWG